MNSTISERKSTTTRPNKIYYYSQKFYNRNLQLSMTGWNILRLRENLQQKIYNLTQATQLGKFATTKRKSTTTWLGKIYYDWEKIYNNKTRRNLLWLRKKSTIQHDVKIYIDWMGLTQLDYSLINKLRLTIDWMGLAQLKSILRTN